MEHAPIAETARTSQFRPVAMAVAEGFEPYPGCWSRARKALYLRKHFTVNHTQTYILVGKCGQNVGTTVAGPDSRSTPIR
jgi:hypothetical protein